MKKLIAFLLVFVMLLPDFAVSFAADKADDGRYPVADLSSINVIAGTGLTASSEYKKTGPFTAHLSGIDLYRNIEIPVSTNDFSGGEYLEFYLYSPAKYNTRFALALYSDDKSNLCKDYYYTMIDIDFEGWKLVSVELDKFKAVHSPKGIDDIDYMCIMPRYSGYGLGDDTKLYFDTIYVTTEQSPGANEASADLGKSSYVLLDPEKGVVGSTSAVELDSIPCLRWAGEKDIKEAIQISTAGLVDFSQYGTLSINVYSKKATDNLANIHLYADNPATAGKIDYYRTSFTIDWENEWRTVQFILNEGANGDFSTGHTPIGWNTITMFDLGIGGSTNEEVSPDNELYIGQITLEGEPYVEKEIIPGQDYILDNKFEEDMVNYAEMLQRENPDNKHPRLILNDDKIAQILELKDTDTFLVPVVEKVIDSAEKYINDPVTPAPDPGKDVNETPSTLIPTCCLAFIITGDVRYKDRAWLELENILSYENWNPNHFLDVGEYSRAVALAYDWLYDYWTSNERQIMRNGVMKLAFTPAVKQLRRGYGSWLSQRSNWVEVGASGIGLCALAFGDEDGYEELCSEILDRIIVDHLPSKGMFLFAPDGAYSEGLGYWNYALYTFYQLTNAMHTSLGTDMGLEDLSGLDKTGYFPIAMRGPNGVFAFSDSSVNNLPGGAPVYHYVGKRYNLPNLSSYRLQKYTEDTENLDYRDVIWYDPDFTKLDDWTEGLNPDYFASGHEPLGSFRTGYDKTAYYFGFKGGNNNGNHDQYDIGSFVIDANGVRWAEEIGPEGYTVTGERFHYYRNRAEGNNTMVINPDGDTHDQTSNADKNAICDYIDKGSNDGAAYGVFDLTKAYYADLTKAHRGFGLINNRTQFVIQDEITAPQPSEYYAFFHVKQDIAIDIAADGKSLVLTSDNGQKCAVNLVSSASNAKFGQMEAIQLSTSPAAPNDSSSNSNFHKFFVYADNVTDASFTIIYTPLIDDSPVSLPDIKPLKDWGEYITSSISLTSLSIDGIPESGFSPGVANYLIPTDTVGTVSATADNGAIVTVTQASQLGETAVIRVQSTDGTQEGIYRVKFQKPLDPPIQTGADIVSAKASDVPQSANVPENTYDGKLNTRWSAEGEQWLEWDLGSLKTVNGISLAFMSGETRSNVFKIDVSEDGINYTTVFEGKSSGKTSDLEKYDFDVVWARYVRYTGFGNENSVGEMINPWNSVAEVVVHEVFTDFADTIGHWANGDINYLRQYSLVNGISDTQFAPDAQVTAAEYIVMICRALGLTELEYKNSFYDVTSEDWFSGYVAAAVLNDIIPSEMTKDGSLRPYYVLTRAQMAAIAVKAYESVSGVDTPSYGLTDKFTDIIGSEYAPYIDKAVTLRLVNGVTNTSFEPHSGLTRAQAATIVKRLFVKLYNEF